MDSNDFLAPGSAGSSFKWWGEEVGGRGESWLVVLMGNRWREKEVEGRGKKKRGAELLPPSLPRHPLASYAACSPVPSITGLGLGALFWELETHKMEKVRGHDLW